MLYKGAEVFFNQFLSDEQANVSFIIVFHATPLLLKALVAILRLLEEKKKSWTTAI